MRAKSGNCSHPAFACVGVPCVGQFLPAITNSVRVRGRYIAERGSGLRPGGNIGESVLPKRKTGVAKKPKAPNHEGNIVAGSMFRDILSQIRRIPHGKVATYGDVAYAAGYP